MLNLSAVDDTKDVATKEYVDGKAAVTGVKGNSESAYRTGQVNLTAANIGAAASSHNHAASNITSGTLGVARGGTGASTLGAGLVYHSASGTGALSIATAANIVDAIGSAAVANATNAANADKVNNLTVQTAVPANAVFTDTTYSAATQSAPGLMTASDKTKLDGIAAGAEVNVQSDWNATSGDALILNKPTIPTVPSAYTSNPKMDGTASAGSSTQWAKGDHVHPTDTSRAAATHNHAASEVTSGTFDAARIPDLAASKITSGTLGVARGGTGVSTLGAGVVYHSANGTGALSIATAANIVSALGTTAVNRATADASGNTITSTYATKTHQHAATDITSGVLAEANGGTGATSFGAALDDEVLTRASDYGAIWLEDDEVVNVGGFLPTSYGGVPSGGTTGQVLTKKSNTSGDLEWTTPSTGGTGRQSTYYTTCSTAAGTAAKVITISGYTPQAGDVLTVYFSTANTANAPTINLNSTGAKAIYVGSAAASATNQLLWSAGDTLMFAYSGSYWYFVSRAKGDTFTTLYNNATGTNGTVTLSSSAANFDHMRIYFKKSSGQNGVGSVDVYSPNGKYANLTILEPDSGGAALWFVSRTVYINGTSISTYGSVVGGVISSSPSCGSSTELNIIRVEGWK